MGALGMYGGTRYVWGALGMYGGTRYVWGH